MKNRDFSLDVIRIIACCMIVFMHSPIPSESASGLFLTSLSYFTAPGIGLFFMVSGSLLMPVKTGYFMFLRRRLNKIVVPTLIWTAIYLALKIYFSESEINILQSILSVPFSAQGHGVLWFMYTLTGIYLLAPILGAWLEKANVREIECVLSLWCISLCFPIVEPWLVINNGTTGILYYFTGYAGYFLLGYYLKHFAYRLPMYIPTAISILGIVLLLFLKFKSIEFDFYRLFWYESIFIAALSCTVWKFVSQIQFINWISDNNMFRRQIITFSNLSFGIYLSHILIMRYLLWDMECIQNIENYIIQTIAVGVITLAISYILCVIISRTALAQYIIGYRKSNI